MIDYLPEEIAKFYCCIYEWIDDLSFCAPLSAHIENWVPYEEAVKKKIRRHGWAGNGAVQLLWLPPFVLKDILRDGVDDYLKKVGKAWTSGLVLWHTKQKEDGLSFILSPVRLEIPSVGLDA